MCVIGILIAILAAAIIIGVIAYVIYTYNRFKALEVATQATLGQIRVALRKRLDMITQLAEATREYAIFEKETLENITKMRAAIATATPEQIRDIDRESRAILGRIIAVAEAYPTLRTAEAVSKLMDSIKSIEDEIARLRYTYNNIVQEYNTRIRTFPSNIIAGMIGARELPYLHVGGREIEERPRIRLREEK